MLDLFTRGDEHDTIRLALAALSLVASLVYLSVVNKPAGSLRTWSKTASITLLAPLPLLVGGSVGHIALAFALAFGSLGDYFLALKDEEKSFKRGILAFLVGHIFYLIVMVPHLGAPSPLQIAGMALLAAMAIGVCGWLSPKLGKYRNPVWAYMGVISLMALSALSVYVPLAGIGALLFVFSDAVIVVNQFGRPVPYRGPIVWITYYIGQILLAGSLLALLH